VFVDAGASVSVDGALTGTSQAPLGDRHRFLSIEDPGQAHHAFEAWDAGWLKVVAKQQLRLGGNLTARGASGVCLAKT